MMLSLYLSMIDDETSRTVFEQIYLLYRHTMIYEANQILNDQMLAEDAVHDAFLRMMNQLENISDPECHKTRAFVVIVVRNIALDMYRRKQRQAEKHVGSVVFADAEDALNPEEIYEQKELCEDINRVMNQMHPAYAEILALKYTFEYSDQEIAQLLGITHENARTRLHRAKQQLKQKLAVYEEGDGVWN